MKPLILISNDDGITSEGIKALVETAKNFGQVVVMAPDGPQSAKSHAVTLETPLKYEKSSIFGNDVDAFAVSGTPADCIKLALNVLLDRKPDLVLSGINHGSNVSVNLFYSGTVAAALEGAFHNVPSIAFSITTHNTNINLDGAKKYAGIIIEKVLADKTQNVCLNVNIPKIPEKQIKGIKVCKQTKGAWFEEFEPIEHPKRKNVNYFWLTGKFVNFEEKRTDTDVYAVDNNYVSVVPLKTDLTDYETLNKLKF